MSSKLCHGQKECVVSGPEPSEHDIITYYTPSRKGSKLGALSSLIFRFQKAKSSVSDKRAAASLDITRITETEEQVSSPVPEKTTREIRSGITGRRSESRILAFINSRRQSAELTPTTTTIASATASAAAAATVSASITASTHPVPPRVLLDSAPPAQSASRALDSCDEVPLCALTISMPMAAASRRTCANPTAAGSSEGSGSCGTLDQDQNTCGGARGGDSSAGAPSTPVERGPTPAYARHTSLKAFLNSSSTMSASRKHLASTTTASPCTPTTSAWPGPSSPRTAAEPHCGAPPDAGPVASRARSAAIGATPRLAHAPAGASGPAGLTAAAAPAARTSPRSVLGPDSGRVVQLERTTRLLAMCPSTPAAMRRAHWSLDDYSVQRRLFKSATSSVYEAVCLCSGLPVALKVYHLALVPVNVLHMLWREIQIQAALAHPHVVMLYGAFQDVAAQRLVLVEEYAANGDLHEVHRSLGCRMSEDQARVMVLQPLLEAVVNLHALGVVHRDIKPDNILFTSDWRLVLADFGVAINTCRERAVTRAGTIGYMAPEVERCPIKAAAEENKDVPHLAYTTAADIWAVGCLSYMLLLGFPPFLGSASAGGAVRGGLLGCSTSLTFPGSTSLLARDFICSALAEAPEERPTALQLLRHPWLKMATERHPAAAAVDLLQL